MLPVDVASFEESCGVGVNITPDQVEDCVSTQSLASQCLSIKY